MKTGTVVLKRFRPGEREREREISKVFIKMILLQRPEITVRLMWAVIDPVQSKSQSFPSYVVL